MGGSQSKEHHRVAVLGGGPAGLTATYCLLASDPTLRVDIYESTSRFGGVITTETGGGFQYDLGPNSMNAKHAAVADLLYQKLGLEDRVAKRASSRRFLVVKDGRLLPVPLSPSAFLRSSILSFGAKLRLLMEPLVPRAPGESADRESVAAFFTRRFGREVATYLVDPAVAGIYSASPAQLSMKHAFHRVWTVERMKGSIIGGALRGGFKSMVDPRFPMYTRKQLTESFSYDGGMAVLTDALVERIQREESRARMFRTSPVNAVDWDEGDGIWKINGRHRYDAVISTIPTHQLKQVGSNVRALRRGFRKLAAQISYAPVSVLVLGYDRSQIPQDIHGFGVLIPTHEGRKILGVNFTSEGFPGRLLDTNKVFWTVYLGGGRNPEILTRPVEDIVNVATEELQDVFGVRGAPSFVRVKNWPRGIPTYKPNYDDAVNTMARIEKRVHGLVLAGNYRGGVGVPDALLSGIESAERVSNYLKSL